LNHIKVSVIVPVFNAAKYLEKCIASIICQSLKEIEIIIINDGSTDNCLYIIYKLARLDRRIVVINNDYSLGVSAARNIGIKVAKGCYIGFVDADDWIHSDMYLILYTNAIKFKVDFVVCNSNIYDRNKLKKVRLNLTDMVFDISNSKSTELINLLRFNYDYSNWNKLYSSRIITQNNLLFAEGIHIYEDLLFNCCYFLLSKKFSVVSKSLYNYRIHSESVMNNNSYIISDQYNLLFLGFNSFFKFYDFPNLIKIFNTEMRRGFYFSILPKLTHQIFRLTTSYTNKINQLSTNLINVDSELFNYSSIELYGFRGFKRGLLKIKAFKIFSNIVLLKKYFSNF